MSSTLRLIDANANRAREALRILEDYTRFILNDDTLSRSLKELRHTLATALAPLLPTALLHRDTENDIGTTITTPTEFTRETLAGVITANSKRLQEALRALEEYLKLDHPEAARTIEQARYTTYTLEQKLALTFRPHHPRVQSAHLYVLITQSACKKNWLDTAKAALQGGADILQLREKEMEGKEFLARAITLTNLCNDHNALCIINDRADIALLSNAHGLHLGQGDLPPTQARKLLGPEKIIGISTHEQKHAHQARLDSADYIGAGPTFPSPTKPRTINPGLPYLTSLKDFPLPTFAIAGITPNNLHEVLSTGCHRIAVTAAVTQSDDPENVCRTLKLKLSPTC